VAALADWSKPAPEFDLCCSLLSLPGIFRTTLATLPAQTPYLHADPEKVRRWNGAACAGCRPPEGRAGLGYGNPQQERAIALARPGDACTARGGR